MLIKNREALIDQLVEMLMQFDKDCNSYQTDIYLYYNEEDQTAKLDTFVNVGGNSWLDDAHYTIYTDKEHYDDGVFSWIQNESEFADILGIPAEQLEEEVRKYNYYDKEDDEELEYYDYREFLKSNDDYMGKLTEAYNDSLEDYHSDYVDKAEYILDRFEEDYAAHNADEEF